jgi:Coenzyme PQQ synthesis protein D (PqqD)
MQVVMREKALLKLTDRVEIPTEVMSRVVGDETVLLDLASGTYFGLNIVAARIWELVGGGRSIADACVVICDEFDANAQTVEADALALGESLLERGLIRIAAATT